MMHSCDDSAPLKNGQGAVYRIEGNRGNLRLNSVIFCNYQFTKYLKPLVSELETQASAELLSDLEFVSFGATFHNLWENAKDS
jgi:hypothetical protein